MLSTLSILKRPERLTKGIVQKMIEYSSITLSCLGQHLLKLLQRRKLGLIFTPHSLGDLGQLDFVTWNRVNLHVEHQLQPMLKFPQPRIVLSQYPGFDSRETLRSLQPLDRVEGVGRSDRGQLAVEQLQELNNELNISNSAVPSFHTVSYTHLPSPRDLSTSRMPSSA